MIRRINDLSYEERLKHLKLPTLRYRRQRGDLIETFKILREVYDPVAIDIFSLSSHHSGKHDSTRGHKYKLFNRPHKLKQRKHFFSNRVVNVWNCLPVWLISAENVRKFEAGLDRILCDQPMVYNYKTKALDLKLIKRQARKLEADSLKTCSNRIPPGPANINT